MELQKLTDAIVAGKMEVAVEIANEAIQNGVQPQTLISDYMIKGMEIIGARFGEGKAFVPNLLMSARAMKACLDLLKPMLQGDSSINYGKIVIGTVKGDLHDIGKNLVASMFEGSGFEVVNLGINVETEKFVQAVREQKPNILCLSALLTTTMNYMRDVIQAVSDAGFRDKIKIMVGGAPINETFAKEIGADAYSVDANQAVVDAKKLLNIS
ncbi:MAG TPA: corrinoid protein [Bacteroidaceae bacterium]|nr:corrinoid protein [Bacteroidaceae bacterium]